MSSRPRLDPSSRMPLPARREEGEAEHGVLHELLELREATARRRSASVELVARSSFSFLAGASSPEALVRTAAALGYDTLGVCDLHGLYGMVRAHEEAKKLGVRLVVGAELVCPLGARRVHVAVHVASHEGYKNLCRILSQAHALRPRDDRAKAEVMLSHLADHARGLFVTLLDSDPEAGREAAGVLAQAFGARASVAATLRLDGHDRERMSAAEDLSRTFALPVLATNRVLFALREDRALFDVLSCIRLKTTLDRAGRALLPNAEAHLKSEDAMHRLFSAHPGWLARSRAVADACTFSLSELDYRFPSDACVEERETPDAALRRLTYEGARLRYDGEVPEKVVAQLEKELALITQLELAPYFLSVRQVVDMARRRDILCQGRGSAANSAVCYCLGVTAVDPARSSMLFERFLSAERAEPPDIDVDFEHERREEVIQEIYATYGRDRAAMVSEIVAYRGKSALREAGKVFGLSPEQVERLASVVSFWDALTQPDTTQALRLAEAGFDPTDPRILHVCAIARKMQGVPRHLSVHVGGFVLSSTDLCEVAPVEPATMEGRTVIPWDKDDIDALGFFKVDVLALGMLTAIRKALELVKDDPRLARLGGATSAIERLARIPPEDPLVYDALCRADTVGVFQIESRAQMAMLPRLQPRCFYDLVVEVAIVRPGPIQGGMVHPYLRRRSGEEAPDAPHPLIAPVLERTLGVPLFQEQVMQLAIVGAGYTGGEADQLRRDMAAWKRHGGLSRHEARLAEGFAKNGISAEFGARLYAQIKGFGEYGFPESHAASFALLVYASAWLKVHHPAAFAAALLNSQPMGFYSPSSILEDARRHGVRALPVCALASDWDTTLVPCERSGRALRVGLREVRGLPEEVGRRLALEARRTPFADVADVEQRAGVRKEHLLALAEAGAFASLPAMGARREAMWAALAPTRSPLFARAEARAPAAPSTLPALPVPPLTRAEQLLLDYERTGLSVTDHPMRIARSGLGRSVLSSRELASAPHGARVRSAGVVLCRQRPGTASGVVFITLEDEHGFVNLVLYARVYERLRRVATTASMLLVEGKVERQATPPPSAEALQTDHADSPRPAAPVVYIVVERLERLSLHARGAGGALPSRSRDFR
ncbi:MAG TPA: error-prone DNA polymerase [Polyangiaceae bacterium]|nr:error-prone DNA polymerase [Polyangiaceae bacterium]